MIEAVLNAVLRSHLPCELSRVVSNLKIGPSFRSDVQTVHARFGVDDHGANLSRRSDAVETARFLNEEEGPFESS